MRTSSLLGLLFLLLALPALSKAQNDSLVTILNIDLGERQLGENQFRATLNNSSDEPQFVVLDVRAMPGMWFGRNQQHQVGYDLAPSEEFNLETTYTFVRMSSEAKLRIRIGPGIRAANKDSNPRLKRITFEETFAIGEGNREAYDIDSDFLISKKGALEVYAWKNSLASESMKDIFNERLSAMTAIAELLDLQPPDLIRIVLYPDGDIKKEQTGHQGAGWAFGTTIVEVYNETVQLNPYHELVHIFASDFGSLPSAFDEGLATFMSEKLGSDALKFLGSPEKSIDLVSCLALKDQTAFPLAELVQLEIGSPESRPPVSYPQSASVVKYLWETFGQAETIDFLMQVGRLENTSPTQISELLAKQFHRPLSELESDWEAQTLLLCR